MYQICDICYDLVTRRWRQEMARAWANLIALSGAWVGGGDCVAKDPGLTLAVRPYKELIAVFCMVGGVRGAERPNEGAHVDDGRRGMAWGRANLMAPGRAEEGGDDWPARSRFDSGGSPLQRIDRGVLHGGWGEKRGGA